MKIDKSIGKWWKETEILDDYAYQLELNDVINSSKTINNVKFGSQFYMLHAYKNNIASEAVVYYYNKAKNELRKEKLQKLNEIYRT